MRFEVYHVPPCACDGEWELLGTVRDIDLRDAAIKARATWIQYRVEELVCIPCDSTTPISRKEGETEARVRKTLEDFRVFTTILPPI